jgi:hypothetical protein
MECLACELIEHPEEVPGGGSRLSFDVTGGEDEIEQLCQDIAWTYWQTSAIPLVVPSVAVSRGQHPEPFAGMHPCPMPRSRQAAVLAS